MVLCSRSPKGLRTLLSRLRRLACTLWGGGGWRGDSLREVNVLHQRQKRNWVFTWGRDFFFLLGTGAVPHRFRGVAKRHRVHSPSPTLWGCWEDCIGSQPDRRLLLRVGICSSSWDFPTLYNNQCPGNLKAGLLIVTWSCPDDTFLGIISSNSGLETGGVQGLAQEDTVDSPGWEVPCAMLRRT